MIEEITPEYQRVLDMEKAFRQELIEKEKMFGEYCIVINVGSKPTFVYKQLKDFVDKFLTDIKTVNEDFSIECFLTYYS